MKLGGRSFVKQDHRIIGCFLERLDLNIEGQYTVQTSSPLGVCLNAKLSIDRGGRPWLQGDRRFHLSSACRHGLGDFDHTCTFTVMKPACGVLEPFRLQDCLSAALVSWFVYGASGCL